MNEVEWYYAAGGGPQAGPVSQDALVQMIRAGQVGRRACS